LNPTRGNRRFILLAIVLGLMGAGLVYVATSRSSGSSGNDGGSAQSVPVVVAKADIPARTAITQDMLDVKLLPPDAVSPLAFTSVQSAVGQVTRYPLAVDEQVLTSKVVDVSGGASVSRSLSFVIPEGKRGFAINASEVQNAGGLVLPGDYVDIILMQDVDYLSNPADPSSRTTEPSYVAQTLMQNVEVLAVAQTVVDVVDVPNQEQDTNPAGATGATGATGPTGAQGDTADSDTDSGSQRVRNSEAAANPGASTVTIAVTPQEAELLYLAEQNGQIRLSVRPFGDDKTEDVDYQLKTELLPPDLPSPFGALR
jgi:pilus assembly protein CpaB